MTFLLATHITGGSLALVGSYFAMFARKGGALHRGGGTLFVYAMILMGTTALLVQLERGRVSSGLGGLFVVYYVATAVTTLRVPTAATRWLDRALTLGCAILSTLTIVDGVDVMVNLGGQRNGVPGPMILFIGSVAMLAVIGDLRVMRSGPRSGRARLVRHLWRMLFAAFFASGSFFLGQMQVIPAPLRIQPLLFALALLPLLLMGYWRWRLRRRGAPIILRGHDERIIPGGPPLGR